MSIKKRITNKSFLTERVVYIEELDSNGNWAFSKKYSDVDTVIHHGDTVTIEYYSDDKHIVHIKL